eukprot:1472812-Prorocentrum_lima.AAC.1
MLQATKDSSLVFYDWQALGHPCIPAFEDMLPLSESEADTSSVLDCAFVIVAFELSLIHI